MKCFKIIVIEGSTSLHLRHDKGHDMVKPSCSNFILRSKPESEQQLNNEAIKMYPKTSMKLLYCKI